MKHLIATKVDKNLAKYIEERAKENMCTKAAAIRKILKDSKHLYDKEKLKGTMFERN